MSTNPRNSKRIRTVVACVLLAVGCPRRLTDVELDALTATRLERFGSREAFDDWRHTIAGANGSWFYGCSMGDSGGGNPGAAQEESITNVQESGVDEGGLVKVVGEHLVSLHQGRLSSVRVWRNGAPVLENAHSRRVPPDGFTKGTWYDELIVVGRRMLVVGYSYELRAAEFTLYDLDAEGAFTHAGSWFVEGGDYYSWTNYASHVVNGKVLLYVPVRAVGAGDGVPLFRRWLSGDTLGDPTPLLAPEAIFRPIQHTRWPMVHTLLRCGLDGADGLSCEATALAAPAWATRYVSPTDAYFWVSDEYDAAPTDGSATVYRIDLNTGALSAARSRGVIHHQLLLDAAPDRGLRALTVREDWDDSFSNLTSETFLVRLNDDAFSTTAAPLEPSTSFRPQPGPVGDPYGLVGRWIGDTLAYVGGAPPELRILTGDADPRVLDLDHAVTRVEALGTDAVVIGPSETGVQFSSISLENAPGVAATLTLPGTSESESRTHGFFFKPAPGGGGALGLPIVGSSYDDEFTPTWRAAMAFLRVDPSLDLTFAGRLEVPPHTSTEAECEVSCFDWYGNTRTIFLADRVLALFGDVVVEGRLSETGIVEERRIQVPPIR